MGGRVDTVSVTKEPFDATFTIKVLCSPSPLTVWAIDYTEPIFDLELLGLGINVAFAPEACE